LPCLGPQQRVEEPRHVRRRLGDLPQASPDAVRERLSRLVSQEGTRLGCREQEERRAERLRARRVEERVVHRAVRKARRDEIARREPGFDRVQAGRVDGVQPGRLERGAMRRPELRRLGVLAQDHEHRRRAARQRVDEIAEPLLLARDLGRLTEEADDRTIAGAESGARLGAELSDIERRIGVVPKRADRQRRHAVTRARQPRRGVVPHEVESRELAPDRVRIAGVVL
jgi:hypothetical protein